MTNKKMSDEEQKEIEEKLRLLDQSFHYFTKKKLTKEKKTYNCLFVDLQGFKKNVRMLGPLPDYWGFPTIQKIDYCVKNFEKITNSTLLVRTFHLVDIVESASWARYEEES